MSKKPVSQRALAVTLLAADIAGLILFFNVSYLIRFGAWPDTLSGSLVWPVVLTLFSLYIVDVYRTDTQVAGMRAPVRTFMGVALAGLLTSAMAYAGGYWSTEQFFGRGVFAMALLLFVIWAAAWRFFLFRWTQQRVVGVRWLVLGIGDAARQFWNDFLRAGTRAEAVFLATGLETSAVPASLALDGLPVVGTLDDLPDWDSKRCSGVVVALPPPLSDNLVQQLMKLRFSGVQVYDLADFYEHYWFKAPVFHLRNGWFVFSHGFDLLHNPLGHRTKRILDTVASALLLVLLAPLLALVAVLIRLDSQGPAIYRQRRIGEGGKAFIIYKFRSMRVNAEQDGACWTSENDTRITRLGRFLRLMRLDELPQLVNVLRGEMSFIGPRPERPEFVGTLEREIPYYELRSLVKPGITGWAQVMYPYGASIEDAREKLQYDLYYIKNYSLLLDIAILFKTVRVMLLGKGR